MDICGEMSSKASEIQYLGSGERKMKRVDVRAIHKEMMGERAEHRPQGNPEFRVGSGQGSVKETSGSQRGRKRSGSTKCIGSHELTKQKDQRHQRVLAGVGGMRPKKKPQSVAIRRHS